MKITKYNDVEAYTTKDGSEIRELMHPSIHSVSNQSIAEAIVKPGEKTTLHVHRKTEEIYHITGGSGEMTLGDDVFGVVEGDTIVIAPGTRHAIRNTGKIFLKILCCCSPAYSHDDTELLNIMNV